MRLTVLGSGAPEATARRASSGYLVETGADKILFDVGGGVVSNLLLTGFAPGDVTHLVLSHLHSDHMMDYARLVHAAWDAGAPPLKVFAPAPFAAINEKLFGRDGAFATDLTARTELPQSQEVWLARGGTLPRPWPSPRITEIGPEFCANADDWRLSAVQAFHAEPLLTCLAFALAADGTRFVYSGDTGITSDIEWLSENADLLLFWCYRLDGTEVSAAMQATTPTPRDIAAMARRAGVGKLVLTHFRPSMDAVFEESVLQTGDLAELRTEVAEDLQVFEISPRWRP